MASFKTNPVFCSVLVVLGLLAAGEGYGIYNRSVAAKKSAAQLMQKRNELSNLQSSKPAPNAANKAAIEESLRHTEAALASMHEGLKGRGPTAQGLRAETVPSQPTDVFFNITTFVERMRDKTKAAEIKIKADERFGFSSYANEGPDRELIPQVFRQRQIIGYLMDALIAARPRELISIQRERPSAPNAATPAPASRSSGSAQVSPDLFEIDPRISARVPGFISASAFRLTFVGETSVLRSLLNKVATFELPLVVRSVEVEPFADTANTSASSAAPANSLASIFGTTAASSAPAEAAPAKPLVEKTPSKFTVTVELIDLVEAPLTEATPTN
jgi:hypothetical protein